MKVSNITHSDGSGSFETGTLGEGVRSTEVPKWVPVRSWIILHTFEHILKPSLMKRDKCTVTGISRDAPTRITWSRSVRWCLAVGLACGDLISADLRETVAHYRWCFTTMRYTNPRLYFTLQSLISTAWGCDAIFPYFCTRDSVNVKFGTGVPRLSV